MQCLKKKLFKKNCILPTADCSLPTEYCQLYNMDIEALRHYCLSKKAATEDMPFGETTLVFRVLGKDGKIFALMSLDEEEARINLKCNPEYAIELRENHPESVIPGYHMNKVHWNTVYCERGLDDKFIRSLIDHSYDVIVASLKKSLQQQLTEM